MELQTDHINAHALVAYGPDWVSVRGGNPSANAPANAPANANLTRHSQSLFLSSRHGPSPWGLQALSAIGPDDFLAALALSSDPPELILLATGQTHRLLHPAKYRPLIDQGIGLEVMAIGPACRTYNVLAAEGRHVVAMLALEPVASL